MENDTDSMEKEFKDNSTKSTEKEGENIDNGSVKVRYILFLSIIIGLFLNFLQTYIRITMGLLGVGVGTLLAVLLLAKFILKGKNGDSKRNFTIIAIAFGATQAAEASIGMLFLIWLTLNSNVFGLTFNPPSWLLPSESVIKSRTLLSSQWITPIFVHLFLMIVPGIVGLSIGWILKDHFVKNEEDYPFPSVIQTATTIDVLSEKNSQKGKIFKRWVLIGFVFAVVTFPFFALDLSSPTNGYIIGLTLGPIGLALFSAGFIINKQSITLSVGLSSVLAYSILSTVLIGRQNLDYFDFFNYGIEHIYLSIAIGLLLGGIILGPLVMGILKSFLQKFRQSVSEPSHSEKKEEMRAQKAERTPKDKIKERFSNNRIIKFILFSKWNIALILLTYGISTLIVLRLDVFGNVSTLIIIIVLFWIIVIGGFVNGFLMISGSAKSGAIVTPPFIFDEIPIFLTGVSGYLPFVALPHSESDGSLGIVRASKLVALSKIDEKLGLISYLCGYLASSLTIPFFAILLYVSFGIGTVQLPAPAFPIQGALLSAFASRSITEVISVVQLVAGIIGGIVLAGLGSNLALGFSIGFFFPPHMALALTLGGLARYLYGKKNKNQDSNERAMTIGTGIAVGGSLVIPIMIFFALI